MRKSERRQQQRRLEKVDLAAAAHDDLVLGRFGDELAQDLPFFAEILGGQQGEGDEQQQQEKDGGVGEGHGSSSRAVSGDDFAILS